MANRSISSSRHQGEQHDGQPASVPMHQVPGESGQQMSPSEGLLATELVSLAVGHQLAQEKDERALLDTPHQHLQRILHQPDLPAHVERRGHVGRGHSPPHRAWGQGRGGASQRGHRVRGSQDRKRRLGTVKFLGSGQGDRLTPADIRALLFRAHVGLLSLCSTACQERNAAVQQPAYSVWPVVLRPADFSWCTRLSITCPDNSHSVPSSCWEHVTGQFQLETILAIFEHDVVTPCDGWPATKNPADSGGGPKVKMIASCAFSLKYHVYTYIYLGILRQTRNQWGFVPVSVRSMSLFFGTNVSPESCSLFFLLTLY